MSSSSPSSTVTVGRWSIRLSMASHGHQSTSLVTGSTPSSRRRGTRSRSVAPHGTHQLACQMVTVSILAAPPCRFGAYSTSKGYTHPANWEGRAPFPLASEEERAGTIPEDVNHVHGVLPHPAFDLVDNLRLVSRAAIRGHDHPCLVVGVEPEPHPLVGLITSQNDTAPKPTAYRVLAPPCLITSQNDTAPKLAPATHARARSLITSQNDTAPKPGRGRSRHSRGLITSQNDTAPKPTTSGTSVASSLITSQNDTAPKLTWRVVRACHCLITSQNDTAPKPRTWCRLPGPGLITSQNDTAPKLLEQNPLCKRRPFRLAPVTQCSIKSRSITLLLS